MSWDCFYSPEVSSNIISVLDIVSNSLIWAYVFWLTY
jgi:hypothetical protein